MKPETRRLIARELLILGAIIVGAACASLLFLHLGLYNSLLAVWFSPKGIVLIAYFFRWVVWAYQFSQEFPDLAGLANRCGRVAGLTAIGTGLVIAGVELITDRSPEISPIVLGLAIAAPGCWLMSVGNRGQQKQESHSGQSSANPADASS